MPYLPEGGLRMVRPRVASLAKQLRLPGAPGRPLQLVLTPQLRLSCLQAQYPWLHQVSLRFAQEGLPLPMAL